MAVIKDALKARLRLSEGLRLKPYLDTVGVLTIGYGLNLNEGMYLEEAEFCLDLRSDKAITNARAFYPGFDALTEARQIVLAEMAYNLGLTRLKKFKKFLAALTKGDYAKAAQEMEQSVWAVQVKRRAKDLAAMMKKG